MGTSRDTMAAPEGSASESLLGTQGQACSHTWPKGISSGPGLGGAGMKDTGAIIGEAQFLSVSLTILLLGVSVSAEMPLGVRGVDLFCLASHREQSWSNGWALPP